MDLDSILPPPLPNMEGKEGASGLLMTMGEFYGFKAPGRELVKAPGDDYFYHQRIVRRYMIYNDHLLLIHDAGVGKTRSAMGFLTEILDTPLKGVYRKILIVAPTSLHEEWKKTTEYQILSKRVSLSLISFLDLSAMVPEQHAGSLIVVDEVHKFASEDVMFRSGEIDFRTPSSLVNGSRTNSILPIYKGIWNMIHNTPLSKTILLTATPMRNSPEDFYPVVNLILPEGDQIWDSKNLPDDEELKTLISGRISYVRAADEGIEISHEMGSQMLTSIYLSQFSSGVGEIVAARLLNPVENYTYELLNLPEKEFPITHFKLELMDGSDYIVLDLVSQTTIPSNEERFSCDILEGGKKIKLTKLPPETDTITVSVPSLCNNRLRVETEGEEVNIPVTESILTPYHSHIFVRNKAEQNTNPLQGQGPAVFNSYLLLSTLTDLEIEPRSLMDLSSLYYTVINVFLRTLAPESRGPIRDIWKEHIFDEIVEVGKNIFYYEFTEARGGIEDLARILEMVGYERFENKENRREVETLGKKPRFVVNPSDRDRILFNHPDNWEGAYIHISLYSERGATGVNYLDVRHIHRIPHWTPSENTQSLFRGIRAKSHDNIRTHIPDLKIRVYSHISTPNPAIINYNNTWVSEGITIDSETYDVNLGEENDPLNPGFEEMVPGAHPISIAREFDSLYSRLPVQPPRGSLQLTVYGFSLEHLPNPSVHPNMTLTDLRLPEREGFPAELATTFYSPTAYRYWKATNKDVVISRIKRIYKIAAMDCNLNRNRNILPSTYDNTEQCDYMECDYECLPEERGLEIVIDTVDPETGEDVRKNRNDPWAPISLPRFSTWEAYGRLSEYAREEYVKFLVELFSSTFKGYMSIFSILVLTQERFRGDREVTETQALELMSDIVHGKLAYGRFRDSFDNPCTLREHGDVIYLCPLYESERKLRLQPKSTSMSRALHGPRVRLFTNKTGWKRVITKPKSTDELKDLYLSFRDQESGEETDLLERCFNLAASDFHSFVEVVEGAYLWWLLNGLDNPIRERFDKYFSQTEVRLRDIDKIYIGGSEGKRREVEYVTPSVSAWGEDAIDQNPRIHFHFLYHLHPSLSEVRKLLSENALCKIMVRGMENMGFLEANVTEQKILYEIHNKVLTNRIIEFSQRPEARGRPVGIFDERTYIQGDARGKMEFFKLYRYSAGAKKDPQGQVCTSLTASAFKDISSQYGVSQEGGKTERCKKLFQKMKEQNMIW